MDILGKIDITAVILTRNEGRNLRAALESIRNFVSHTVIIDSNSTDETLLIAHEYDCEVINFPAATQSTIYTWFFKEYKVKTEWVLRIDADERWTPEGFQELSGIIETGKYDGVYVNRKTFFMGKPLMYGGYYPIRLLLVWRAGRASIEDRLMDEHITVEGTTFLSKIDVLEQNYDRQFNLSLWTEKHNRYSDRYAAEELLMKRGLIKRGRLALDLRNSTSIKSQLRVFIYDRLPPFIRPTLYYVFRYVFLLGFMDGKSGFIYHYLQGFWFRFLVDAKIIQMEKAITDTGQDTIEYLREHFGISVVDGKIFFLK
jgi:glycosyltransferase involved in cell wall biosynthesis